MCSHWILYYDKKDVSISLANLGENVAKAISDKTKMKTKQNKFYFSHEIETVSLKYFLWMLTEKNTYRYTKYPEGIFESQGNDISFSAHQYFRKKNEMVIPFSSTFCSFFSVHKKCHKKKLQFIDLSKKSSLMAFKCQNFLIEEIS